MIQVLRLFALLAALPLLGWAQGATPFNLEAADVQFDASASRVLATGGEKPVVVTSDQGRVEAQSIQYNIASDRLLAEGNVTFTDPSGTALTVDRMELTGDLKAGTLEKLRLALPVLGEVGQASSGEVSGSRVTLRDITYSPCKECIGGRKPWQIEADQATYDQEAGTMTYRGAKLDVYGVPVAYVPWFRHPLGTDNPQSGLLPPGFGRSEALGDQLTLGGYVWSPSENADYTMKTRLMSARGAQFMAERRQVGENLRSEVRGSFINDTALPPGDGHFRNHAEVLAEYNFSPSRRVGANAEVTSDDTYLNQYFDRTDPYLMSTAYAEEGTEDMYLGASLVNFRDLNPAAAPERTAQVMPHLQAQRWWALGPRGAQLNLSGDVLALERGLGTDTRRIATRAAYTVPTLLLDGSKLTFGATVRADMYSIEGGKNGAVTRMLPELTAKWEKPYISADGNHQITPIVMLAMSPRGGNMANKIPNEDSVAYELDTTNLFEASRFAGIDRVETGPRLIYGLDNRWGSADDTDYRVFVGQSLRRFDDSTLPDSGGARTNGSDFVGEVEASPHDYFSTNARMRLDNATFVVRRMDAGLTLGRTEGYNLSSTYSFLSSGPESLTTTAEAPLSRNWKLDLSARHDLRSDTLLEAESALTWLRDCYAIEFIARRKGFRSTNLTPSTDYLVNVQLLTLGRDDETR